MEVENDFIMLYNNIFSTQIKPFIQFKKKIWEVGSFIELLENENSYSGRQFYIPGLE